MTETSLITGAQKQKILFRCVTKDQWPVVLSGDAPELGAWELAQSLPTQARPRVQGGYEWTVQIELSLGRTVEYKFVKKCENGPRWESGNNHRITVIPGLHTLDADFRE